MEQAPRAPQSDSGMPVQYTPDGVVPTIPERETNIAGRTDPYRVVASAFSLSAGISARSS